jgi:hypothetical protein
VHIPRCGAEVIALEQLVQATSASSSSAGDGVLTAGAAERDPPDPLTCSGASPPASVIVLLRQLRMTAAEIAETRSMPLSTVSVILKRQGRNAELHQELDVWHKTPTPG